MLSSAFFMVQLSHPYMTTGKTIALTIRTFVGKVMSLHLNTLLRFVTDSFPRSKHLLISWLQSPSTVILEHPKIKSVTVSIVSPPICHEVMGQNAMILFFWILSLSQYFHSLLSPFPPVFNLSQHQGLFQWVSSSHQVARVLEFQPQHQSFQWIFRTDFFKIDGFDLLAVQGTLKSLIQHHC